MMFSPTRSTRGPMYTDGDGRCERSWRGCAGSGASVLRSVWASDGGSLQREGAALRPVHLSAGLGESWVGLFLPDARGTTDREGGGGSLPRCGGTSGGGGGAARPGEDSARARAIGASLATENRAGRGRGGGGARTLRSRRCGESSGVQGDGASMERGVDFCAAGTTRGGGASAPH